MPKKFCAVTHHKCSDFTSGKDENVPHRSLVTLIFNHDHRQTQTVVGDKGNDKDIFGLFLKWMKLQVQKNNIDILVSLILTVTKMQWGILVNFMHFSQGQNQGYENVECRYCFLYL